MYACGQLDGPTFPDQENPAVLEPSNSSNQAYVFRYNDDPTSLTYILHVEKEVLIYPNPSSNWVHVVVEDLVGLELYSSDGRRVLQSANSSFNVFDLPLGVYYLRCITNKGNRNTRLVVGF